MNRLVLAATLVERGAVRYTPAGCPALDLLLKHESEVSEDGVPRKVSLEKRGYLLSAVLRAPKGLLHRHFHQVVFPAGVEALPPVELVVQHIPKSGPRMKSLDKFST